jgi:dTDP-4-amino-4,6-dideoxygalactose transaminase
VISIAAPEIRDAERERVLRVLDSGQLAAGDQVEAFQREFADYCGADHGVATSNGTTALHAALHALGVGEGDTVVTTPFSFIATANAIRFCGARPVFVDIDPRTYNLDPDAVAETLRTRDDVAAVLAVHLYGLPAAMGELRSLADEHGVALVEDAAQAHGARYRGEPVGSLGDAACFSFYPTKNMTTGEGGMVTTDDPEVAERTERFADHGRTEGYRHAEVGHNFRMTDIAAAIGRAQLERLPDLVERRRANAELLTERLADTPVTTPVEPADCRHAYHQYTIRTADREALRAHCREAGVGTGVYYPIAIHDQPAYEGYDLELPAVARATDEVLSLPVHPALSRDELEQVARAVRSFSR